MSVPGFCLASSIFSVKYDEEPLLLSPFNNAAETQNVAADRSKSKPSEQPKHAGSSTSTTVHVAHEILNRTKPMPEAP